MAMHDTMHAMVFVEIYGNTPASHQTASDIKLQKEMKTRNMLV